jgi:hypothetical protein
LPLSGKVAPSAEVGKRRLIDGIRWRVPVSAEGESISGPAVQAAPARHQPARCRRVVAA